MDVSFDSLPVDERSLEFGYLSLNLRTKPLFVSDFLLSAMFSICSLFCLFCVVCFPVFTRSLECGSFTAGCIFPNPFPLF
uniref:Transmembrane protein n=1 Tax=Ciona intestinalis TaxID=7719 RepID=H2XN02_CIOIN